MYRVRVNAVSVEADTPAEVAALVAALDRRTVEPAATTQQKLTPAKAAIRKQVVPRDGSGPAARRQQILNVLRDRPKFVHEMAEDAALAGLSKGTIYNDLQALEKAGAVQR